MYLFGHTSFYTSIHLDSKGQQDILATAAAYNNKAKRCNFCLAEKFYLIEANKAILMNKRSELISKYTKNKICSWYI